MAEIAISTLPFIRASVTFRHAPLLFEFLACEEFVDPVKIESTSNVSNPVHKTILLKHCEH